MGNACCAAISESQADAVKRFYKRAIQNFEEKASRPGYFAENNDSNDLVSLPEATWAYIRMSDMKQGEEIKKLVTEIVVIAQAACVDVLEKVGDEIDALDLPEVENLLKNQNQKACTDYFREHCGEHVKKVFTAAVQASMAESNAPTLWKAFEERLNEQLPTIKKRMSDASAILASTGAAGQIANDKMEETFGIDFNKDGKIGNKDATSVMEITKLDFDLKALLVSKCCDLLFSSMGEEEVERRNDQFDLLFLQAKFMEGLDKAAPVADLVGEGEKQKLLKKEEGEKQKLFNKIVA